MCYWINHYFAPITMETAGFGRLFVHTHWLKRQVHHFNTPPPSLYLLLPPFFLYHPDQQAGLFFDFFVTLYFAGRRTPCRLKNTPLNLLGSILRIVALILISTLTCLSKVLSPNISSETRPSGGGCKACKGQTLLHPKHRSSQALGVRDGTFG